MTDVQLLSDVERLVQDLAPLPEPVAQPIFVAVSGLPGTGKSYFCGKLAERLPFLILESDVLRKSLFLSPSYSQPESELLFRTVHLLIERHRRLNMGQHPPHGNDRNQLVCTMGRTAVQRHRPVGAYPRKNPRTGGYGAADAGKFLERHG